MQTHEYYEELCALAATGQLSAGELRDLNSHLKKCASCRRTNSDFSLILGQLPSVDAKECSDNIAVLQSKSYRERFLTRAESEGINFPSDVRGPATRHNPFVVRKQMLSWALASVAAALVAFGWFHGRPKLTSRIVEPARAGLHGALPVAESALPIAPTPPAPDAPAQLNQKLHDYRAENSALKARLDSALRERDAYRSLSVTDKDRLAELNQRVDQLQQSLGHTQVELDREKGEKVQTEASLVEQQVQLSDLREQLKVRDAAVERERQLSAAAKDVRELMGARNLHIIDVADVDARGRSRKAFGRVFFVEDRSLIFYAFDLSEAASNAKVLFHAWGQREGSGIKPRSLGVFRVDDHSQRRWVLRVEDAKLLSGIDSLFVTVESNPGADQPSGRKLIYAYLGTEPNHP